MADSAAANDPQGPLWYRGLSGVQETCEVQHQLDAMLETRQAKRIVVAHTPNAGAVLARYGGRVIVVDVGLSAYYGGARAALIIEGEKISAMHEGRRLEPLVPVSAYLKQVADATAEDAPMLEKFMNGAVKVNLDQILDCPTPEPGTVEVGTP